jgi:hypothetical protein
MSLNNQQPPPHHNKSLRPVALAIMGLNKGLQFSAVTSMHRKRRMSTLVEKEGVFGPALTVCPLHSLSCLELNGSVMSVISPSLARPGPPKIDLGIELSASEACWLSKSPAAMHCIESIGFAGTGVASLADDAARRLSISVFRPSSLMTTLSSLPSPFMTWFT